MKTGFRRQVSGVSAILALFFMLMPVLAQAQDELPRKQQQLFELVRHLYRWYLDEEDVGRIRGSENVTFWLRELRPALDEGDRSRFVEIALPQLDMVVHAKKADYDIEELGVTVRSDAFKITNVARDGVPAEPPEEAEALAEPFQAMMDYLFRTRKDAVFPEGEFLERLRAAVRKELLPEGAAPPKEVQVVHLAPLSPVANEVWVYWETGRRLIRFSSDIDIANPAVWDHETLMVRTWDVESQVVVSMDEAPGSGKVLTRDQVGRALYYCIVLGRRAELQPPAEVVAQP